MTTSKSIWETFFDAHAPIYETNIFTKNTMQEVDFLIEELALQPGNSLLDVGCGIGRHSVELAKRGFVVTGLDLSSGMLSQAAESAKNAGVSVQWVQSNATQFSFKEKFDAAICLCEGSFGLLGQSDDPILQPLSILSNISRSLKPKGKLLLTALNATLMIRKYSNSDVAAGRFNPFTLTESSEMAPRENEPAIPVRERGFVPTELRLLCHIAGFSILNMWGGTAGNWGHRPLDLDEIEIMIVAIKTSDPLRIGDIGKSV